MVAVVCNRCMIVKTNSYNREEVGRVVQLRATVESLKLGEGVLERLAEEGERASLRLVLLCYFGPIYRRLTNTCSQIRLATSHPCLDTCHARWETGAIGSRRYIGDGRTLFGRTTKRCRWKCNSWRSLSHCK